MQTPINSSEHACRHSRLLRQPAKDHRLDIHPTFDYLIFACVRFFDLTSEVTLYIIVSKCVRQYRYRRVNLYDDIDIGVNWCGGTALCVRNIGSSTSTAHEGRACKELRQISPSACLTQIYLVTLYRTWGCRTRTSEYRSAFGARFGQFFPLRVHPEPGQQRVRMCKAILAHNCASVCACRYF